MSFDSRAISRRSAVIGLGSLVFAGMVGCGGSSTSASSSSSSAASYKSLVIGTLATEDILPMWVAEAEGAFTDAGLDASVMVFQSATELIAGVSSGSVNLAMTDPMVAASIFASGTDIKLSWVTLGTTAAQGRFGIQTGPESGITSLADLAGQGIGVGSNTILEYVMDKLMERAGVADSDIVTAELQKLPVRYQAMMSGEVKAAALPGSLLALGEASGATTLADDTMGDNISQSVMIVRTDWLEGSGADTLAAVKGVWDDCAKRINANPESYRSLLVEKANLSDAVASTYPISEYPTCTVPTNAMVDPILEWMTGKGYLTRALSYDGSTGEFKAQ